MLMGRDQMAVLHSFLIKERCKILQAELATQKRWDSAISPSEIYIYFLPLKIRGKGGFCFVRLVPILFSLGQFMLLSTPPRQRRKGQDIWGISTYQCCDHLFRVQSKSSPSGGPARDCVTAAAWPSLASPGLWQFSTSWAMTTPHHEQSHGDFHLLKYVANRESIMTAMKYHLRSLSFKEKE